jgi:cell division protein FtsW (lipid II flippase)
MCGIVFIFLRIRWDELRALWDSFILFVLYGRFLFNRWVGMERKHNKRWEIALLPYTTKVRK